MSDDDAIFLRTRQPRYWLLAPASLLFQVLPPLGLMLLAIVAYGANARVAPQSIETLSHIWLGATAIAGGALAISATYRTLRHIRARVAVPVVVLVCFPALVLSMFYLYALLVFLGLL